MPTSEERKPFHHRRVQVVWIIFALFIGLQGLYSVTQSSHFASYRTVDVLRLVVSGAALGAALVALMVLLLRPRD
jgi:hypothetical protein